MRAICSFVFVQVKITIPSDTKLVIHKKTATYETEIVYNLSANGTEVNTVSVLSY